MNDLMELVRDCGPLENVEPAKLHALEKMRELQELGLEWVAAQMRDKILLQEKLECVAREKYSVVTPAKIQAFLDRTAKKYNEDMVKKYGKKRSSMTATAASFGNAISINTSLLQNLQNNMAWIGSGVGPARQFATTSSGSAMGQLFGGGSLTNQIAREEVQLYAVTDDLLSPADERIRSFNWVEVPIKDYKAIPPETALRALKSAQAKEIFDTFVIASVVGVKDPLLLGRLNGNADRYFLAQWGDDIALDDVI